jgi:hypothetical protein
MKRFRKRVCLLSGAANVVLLNAGPNQAQMWPLRYSAFARYADSGSESACPGYALHRPQTASPNGGHHFTAGSSTNGIKMGKVLDRKYRNR